MGQDYNGFLDALPSLLRDRCPRRWPACWALSLLWVLVLASGAEQAWAQRSESLLQRSGQHRPRPVYRLGPGDRLYMSVFKVDGYAAEVEVLSDGTINLPRIGAIQVWGLTVEEARQRISTSYDAILRRPLVYLDLREARPIRVAVSGEVQKPGLYSLTSRGGSAQLNSAGATGAATTVSAAGWPTLVDAIQRAGGITALGDLSAIEILRPGSAPGAPPLRLRFDFMPVLRSGALAENPLVYDGDTILVERSVALSNEDLLRTASSSFAPDTIQVQVVGEVMRPGLQQIRSNSPLAMAIHAAGGPTRRASTTTVQLIRLEPNGEHTLQTVRLDPGATLSSADNPPLRQGDVLVVDRHLWAKFNDGMRDTLEPISPVINAASLFRLFGL